MAAVELVVAVGGDQEQRGARRSGGRRSGGRRGSPRRPSARPRARRRATPLSSSAMSAPASSYGRGAVAATRSSSPPAMRAMSRNGPSGRGVKSGSQAPQRTTAGLRRRRTGGRARSCPTPASPRTSTSRPRRVVATRREVVEGRRARRSARAARRPRAAVASMQNHDADERAVSCNRGRRLGDQDG